MKNQVEVPDGSKPMTKTLLPVAEAIDRIAAAMPILEAETVPIAEARGRILAENITARLDNPPQNISAMDGYAVMAEDVARLPASLTVIGESSAGKIFDHGIERGQCVQIFTGAQLPPRADTIIIIEDTTSEGTGSEGTGKNGEIVTIHTANPPGRYIRKKGQDFTHGATLVPSGVKLTARLLGLCAAAGYAHIKVRRKPTVAIASTGNELVEIGTMPSSPTQIIGSNTLMLTAMIEEMGAIPSPQDIISDDMTALKTALSGLEENDLVIVTGGASIGKYDLVTSMMRETGTIDFWGIAMRPGKPVLFGKIPTVSGETPFLGFPGNPVSAGVCALILGGAAIKAMLGLKPHCPTETAILSTTLDANDKRQDYLRARLERDGQGQLIAASVAAQDSGKIFDFATSDGLIIRPPYAPKAHKGEVVEIIAFSALF